MNTLDRGTEFDCDYCHEIIPIDGEIYTINDNDFICEFCWLSKGMVKD